MEISPTNTSPTDTSQTGHFPDRHIPDGHFPDGTLSRQTHPRRTLPRRTLPRWDNSPTRHFPDLTHPPYQSLRNLPPLDKLLSNEMLSLNRLCLRSQLSKMKMNSVTLFVLLKSTLKIRLKRLMVCIMSPLILQCCQQLQR